ncbi:ankyrin repeat domain-containing protein [Legionella quateirensis]|uniref:Ankyrin repeat protein n=1 Tax=Legionella quateirensis TaxID=45072 RepID=A0ABR5RTB0_9GAMM|nr:ankyrin repeat domain-containing protein [Legionella quateirensis]KTD51030.1 Ankyrin repeat protein [Legionella quateirensis]
MPNDPSNSDLFKSRSSNQPIVTIQATLDKELRTEMIKEPPDMNIINRLIDAGANINCVSNHGISLLMVVIAANNNALFDKLMAKGVNVNPVDNKGFNALIAAAAIGNEHMVKELLNAGADPLHKNQAQLRMPPIQSLSPSEWASSRKHTHIVGILKTAETAALEKNEPNHSLLPQGLVQPKSVAKTAAQAALDKNEPRHSLLPQGLVQPKPVAKTAAQAALDKNEPRHSLLPQGLVQPKPVATTSEHPLNKGSQQVENSLKDVVSNVSPNVSPTNQTPITRSTPQINPELELSLAIMLNKDLNEIKRIIQQGSVDVKKLNSKVQSYLVEAVQHNRLDVVNYLLGKRVNLEQEHNVYLPGRPAIPLPNQPKTTALIEAARLIGTTKHLDELKTACTIINTLIDHGANIYKQDTTNKNMMDYLLPIVESHPHKTFLIEHLQQKIPKLSTLHQEKVTLKAETALESPLLEEFNNKMNLFMDKINDLISRRDKLKPDSKDYTLLKEALNSANTLYYKLNKEKDTYLKQITPESYEHFEKNCKEHINTARTVLDKHRGWSEFLVNLAIGITTLGVGLLIKGAVNLANNKSFLAVHQTDSSKKLDDIENSIQNANPRPGRS